MTFHHPFLSYTFYFTAIVYFLFNFIILLLPYVKLAVADRRAQEQRILTLFMAASMIEAFDSHSLVGNMLK